MARFIRHKGYYLCYARIIQLNNKCSRNFEIPQKAFDRVRFQRFGPRFPYKPSILGHEKYSHALLKQFRMTPVIKHHFRPKQLLRIMVEF